MCKSLTKGIVFSSSTGKKDKIIEYIAVIDEHSLKFWKKTPLFWDDPMNSANIKLFYFDFYQGNGIYYIKEGRSNFL